MLASRRPQGCCPTSQITFKTGNICSGSYHRGRPILTSNFDFPAAALTRNARMADLRW